MPIYESDPQPAPEADFVPGELAHLVVGNRGRLLDARRTPVEVTAVTAASGAFEVELKAFEDTGARWELALDEVERFQFARGAALAPAEQVEDLRQAQARYAEEVRIDCTPVAHADAWPPSPPSGGRSGEWLADAVVGVPDLLGPRRTPRGQP